ncbi:TIGR03862 family flavoprotein [Pelagovum pacificum]|uniref:TIGR03862 family flavoprotein n=1 Tax=Pelagovum pacificum TaxID=2588711 RepID=A0A5C5GGC2_9RHOB|nr:TIGR03862 family flavoprotein [Pelagovum pacificum]QQA43071.1 TIGR03862 family flavoprotein [Pelagovum pacificum]TNY33785.1 TIGR03862 family flavoprotein [Pelagovum pacificum]
METEKDKPDALIVGAGPAGLMAAEVLSGAGLSVLVAESMPSPGRKLLMAGKSGLNLTREAEGFHEAYGELAPALRTALDAFGPAEVRAWAEGLGQTLFTGSTGRVFPVVMKASPLLRAWLARLEGQGVELRRRCRFVGWEAGAVLLEDNGALQRLRPEITVLAAGGASWRRLGSDGSWAAAFRADSLAPFAPANAGLRVDWSHHMAARFGDPVKGCALLAGGERSRGEFVISARGLEGGGIYAVSRAVRGGAPLSIDLAPDLSEAEVRARLSRSRGKASLSNHLRKSLSLDPARLALLQEFGRPLPDDLAPLVKALPVRHAGLRPLDEAISTAGGLKFAALDEGLMLKDRPGTFAAGEMLDWEAPTGGYLLTACFATGRHAALAALDWRAGQATQESAVP